MYDYERTSYTAIVAIVLSILLLGVYATATESSEPKFPEAKEYLA